MSWCTVGWVLLACLAGGCVVDLHGGPEPIVVVLGDTPDADHPGTVLDTTIDLFDDNREGDPHLVVYTFPENSISNAVLLKWDLSMIPTSAVVLRARLFLYLSNMEYDGGETLYDTTVHKLLRFDPVFDACDGATYDGSASWTEPLAQGDIDPEEDAVRIDTTYGYKTWSVSSMVQDWVSEPQSNHGMLVNGDAGAAQDSNRFFSASESPNAQQRPKLEVVYHLPPE